MIVIAREQAPASIRFVLTPNRSIGWPLLLRFYLFTCMTSFSIAGLFMALGYWVVMPFSGLEMLALGLGLYFSCKKIYRQEVITIDKVNVKVEKGYKEVQFTQKFNRSWVKIDRIKSMSYRKNIKIMLGSHGKKIEVGSFLTKQEKESLAFELNKGILFDGFMGPVE